MCFPRSHKQPTRWSPKQATARSCGRGRSELGPGRYVGQFATSRCPTATVQSRTDLEWNMAGIIVRTCKLAASFMIRANADTGHVHEEADAAVLSKRFPSTRRRYVRPRPRDHGADSRLRHGKSQFHSAADASQSRARRVSGGSDIS